LARGTYSLKINARAGAPLEFAKLEIGEAVVPDLGDLEIAQGASLRGRVVLAPGTLSEHWRVGVGDWPRGDSCMVRADGGFEMTGLTPGSFDLWVKPPAMKAADIVRRIELVADQTTEVEIDASDRMPARIHLRLTRAGVPLAGYRVRFECEGDGTQPTEATSDSSGTAVATLLPCAGVRATVLAASMFPLARLPAPISVPAGARIEEVLEVDAGELTLLFPEEFAVPANGM